MQFKGLISKSEMDEDTNRIMHWFRDNEKKVECFIDIPMEIVPDAAEMKEISVELIEVPGSTLRTKGDLELKDLSYEGAKIVFNAILYEIYRKNVGSTTQYRAEFSAGGFIFRIIAESEGYPELFKKLRQGQYYKIIVR